jgi:hypothetical protein
MICFKIISTDLFDNISIFVIIVNSGIMILDPGDADSGNAGEETIFDVAEHIFTVLYTLEMALKITGMGFIMGKESYLRDGWNQLDFVIVMSSLVGYI